MPDSSDVESYGKGHRTFDCPWCGAISGVDPSHVGEKFECPECHEHTTLTDENTRDGHITEADREAGRLAQKVGHETSELESYGKGHRTFDCPWCGAISGVDPSHVGEKFECPECHNATKLTDENTRSSPVTVAPPDAPPTLATFSKVPLLAGLAALVVVVIVVVLVLGSGGDDGLTEPAGPGPVAKAPTPTPPADPVNPVDTTPPDEGTVPDEGNPTEAPDEGAPPSDAVPPDEAPPPDEPAPPGPVEEAKARLEVAKQALSDWETAHPGQMEVLKLRQVGSALGEQVRSQLGTLGENASTQTGARSFNDALRAFIAEDPERIRVASYLVIHLDRDGIKPHLLAGWEGLNFYAPRVRETLLEVCGAWGGAEIKEYSDLQTAVAEAQAALTALADAPADGG